MEIKEKILSLIPRKQEMQEVKEIKVTDLKQYIVNGYEEIRKVKQEKIELENELEEEKKNKQLYEGALVTLDEFRRRDEENNKEISRLRKKLRDKQNEVDSINSELNTYKIRQHEYDEKEKKYSTNIKNEIEIATKDLKQKIISNIKNTKGNLSKDTIISIINNT